MQSVGKDIKAVCLECGMKEGYYHKEYCTYSGVVRSDIREQISEDNIKRLEAQK